MIRVTVAAPEAVCHGAMRRSVDVIIAAIAADQHGVVTRLQVVAAGLSKSALNRRVSAGELIPVLPQVYRVAGAPRTWMQGLMAAVLWVGEGAAVSHRAAAAIWKLPGFTSETIEVSGTRAMRRVSQVQYHKVRLLQPKDITIVEGIAVTRPERTLVDLSAVVSRAMVERAIDDLLRRRMVTLESVAEAVVRSGPVGRRGVSSLRRALVRRASQGGPSHSPMEERLYRIMVEAGLPKPHKQLQVEVNGRVFAQFDCGYREAMIGMEADSYRWHATRTDWDHDHDRDRVLKQMGWLVLRFRWEDIYFHPDFIISEVRKALEQRGVLLVSR